MAQDAAAHQDPPWTVLQLTAYTRRDVVLSKAYGRGYI